MTSIGRETDSRSSAPSRFGLARLVFLAIILAVASVSCGGNSTIVEGGYEFYTPAFHSHSFNGMQAENGEVKTTVNGVKLEIKDGRISANGNNLGEIKRGDKITVYEDGKVKINGKVRQPK